MAEARFKEGASFHGVLHRMSAADMQVLDGYEGNVTRKAAKARLYDGTLIDCTVYAEDKDKKKQVGEGDVNNPPPERYVEIMIEGATHFKVKPDYIAKLKALETTPRKPIADMVAFPVPENPRVFTQAEVENGLFEDMPVCHLNGKVLAFVGDKNSQFGKLFAANNQGKEATLMLANAKYDPKYGKVATYEELCDD